MLIINGQFSGNFPAHELKKMFHDHVVDAKEFIEYTPSVLRAYVKPAHLDSLTFNLQPVVERRMGVKFIWGEVKSIDGELKIATIKPIFFDRLDTVSFDYCMICSGCNFGPFHSHGESLWFPTIHEEARKVSSWGHIDERFMEGRRRHILEGKVAEARGTEEDPRCQRRFIGVKWMTLEYFFPQMKLTIINVLPRCLGPLPDNTAVFCSEYMHASGIKKFYVCKYNPRRNCGKGSNFQKVLTFPMCASE